MWVDTKHMTFSSFKEKEKDHSQIISSNIYINPELHFNLGKVFFVIQTLSTACKYICRFDSLVRTSLLWLKGLSLFLSWRRLLWKVITKNHYQKEMYFLHAEENVPGDKKSDDGTNFLALQNARGNALMTLHPKYTSHYSI